MNPTNDRLCWQHMSRPPHYATSHGMVLVGGLRISQIAVIPDHKLYNGSAFTQEPGGKEDQRTQESENRIHGYADQSNNVIVTRSRSPVKGNGLPS